jgi:hypothetical protein
VQLGANIDWDRIDREIAPLYSAKGRPRIESRFVVELLLLKHIYGLSDEDVCERWVHDPYLQHTKAPGPHHSTQIVLGAPAGAPPSPYQGVQRTAMAGTRTS